MSEPISEQDIASTLEQCTASFLFNSPGVLEHPENTNDLSWLAYREHITDLVIDRIPQPGGPVAVFRLSGKCALEATDHFFANSLHLVIDWLEGTGIVETTPIRAELRHAPFREGAPTTGDVIITEKTDQVLELRTIHTLFANLTPEDIIGDI